MAEALATFATHVVGPFLLTSLLLPLLERSGAGRVITVASGGMYATGLSMRNLQSDQGDYDGTDAYARAKRAQVLLTEEWTERTRGRPIPSGAVSRPNEIACASASVATT